MRELYACHYLFAALIWVTVKLFILGIKMTWGIAKFICTVLLFPLFLIGLLMVGALYIAIPVLIVGGIIALAGNLITS